ncbi:MAG: DUF3667 domain-containing protein [Bacteroidota bacterium]
MDKYPIEITEKRTVKRITVKQSMVDFLDAFNIERGLIYTAKLLFLKPGELIRSYLTHGRYKIVNAFRLLIISTALSLIVINAVDSSSLLGNIDQEAADTQNTEILILNLLIDWYNLILWLSIPVYAFISYLFFRKYERYNYAEHMVVQSFWISASNIFVIVILPFGYLFGFQITFFVAFLLGVAFFFYFIKCLFRKNSFWFWVRMIICYLVSNVVYYFFMTFIMKTILYFNG